jgi:hypothetical protein
MNGCLLRSSELRQETQTELSLMNNVTESTFLYIIIKQLVDKYQVNNNSFIPEG